MADLDSRKRARMSDGEDWWGDFDESVPPPPAQSYIEYRRRSRHMMSPASKAMMVLTALLMVFCVCFQLYRLSVITAQNKEIQSLRSTLEQLDSDQQNLDLRIRMQYSWDRIEDQALNHLGMVYPDESQIRVVAVAGTSDGVVTANAAAEGGNG